MFELEPRRRTTPEINLTALMDIAFILVIFIVLAASFQRVRSLDVDLPRADGRATPENEALVVRIPREGPVEIGDRHVPIEEAATALAEARAAYESVVLMAERDADVERAVRLLGDAQGAGFQSVSIATARPDGEVK